MLEIDSETLVRREREPHNVSTMNGQPKRDEDLRRVIASLEERLSETEEALRSQGEAQRRMGGFFNAFRTEFEAAEFVRRRLETEIARQQNELHKVSTALEDLLHSRIWRTLVKLGAFALRLQLKLSGRTPARTHISPAAPKPAPDSLRAPKLPAPIQRASASRHSLGVTTVSQWEQLIRSVVATRAPSTLAKPRISIITPLWNTKPAWLAEAAISVMEQSCSDWEWCLVDDGSTQTDFQDLFPVLEQTGQVKILRLSKNQGISGASNEGLKSATGDYVCFLDHDDLLAPDALQECLDVLDEGFDAVYTDSDKVDEAGLRTEPFHKPDWSAEYFRGVMFVGHLLVVRRDIALEIGGFDTHFSGVQDFEFMIRFSERSGRIGHISKVLYHWRAVEGSIASSPDAKGRVDLLQREAVQAQLDRLGLPATAELGRTSHRVQIVPLPRTHHPKVSIIIPTKDAPDLLQKCLSSLFEKTKYPNFEVVCVDNGTSDIRALHLMRSYPVKRLLFPGRFNFSHANNLGVRKASGEYLVFMNNDIEVIAEKWIEEMLYYAQQQDVGAVGAMLLYPDQTIQHAGVVLGCRGTADHVLRFAPADSDGYAGSLACAREVSAVTAACMMMKREDFEAIGGFNEHYFTAYQDTDLCLAVRSSGKRIMMAPRAVLFHMESKSRGRYYDFVDRNLLLDRWEETIAATDPYYNRNFDVQACDYSLKST